MIRSIAYLLGTIFGVCYAIFALIAGFFGAGMILVGLVVMLVSPITGLLLLALGSSGLATLGRRRRW